MPFTVGEQFASFELLSKRITEIEHRENLSLWKRDSCSIEKVKTKGVKRHMNDDLMYYSVHYACYHGCRKLKSKSAGVRTNLAAVITKDAMKKLKVSIRRRVNMDTWRCACCNVDLGLEKSVECCGCLQWYHECCAGYKRKCKSNWFCGVCAVLDVTVAVVIPFE